MILTKTVKIKVNKGNIPYYKKFDEFKNINIGDDVDVDIKYLSKKNNSKIKYKCDNCGKELETTYKSYCDPRRNKELDLCKGKCANIKREKTNIKLYGVKNCFQNEEMKKKSKETMIEKYGVDHNMKIEKCKNDRKETYIKNYGVDNPSKSEKIKKKKENTCLKNHGVKSPLQNSNIFRKNRISAIQKHKYKNEDITYQGTYELDFLNIYFEKIKINEPNFNIKYIYNGEEHIYHPDFYNITYNLIIEIKSEYTFNKEKYKNFSKKKYAILNGYKFIFVIDKNYLDLERLLKLFSI